MQTEIYYMPEAVSEREPPGYYVINRWKNHKDAACISQSVYGPFPTMKAAQSYVDRRKRDREAKKKVRDERSASHAGLAQQEGGGGA